MNYLYESIAYYWNNNSANYIKKPEHLFISKLNLILFNIDGVLCNNNKYIPIARETFNSLVKRNIPICIITNECRKSPKLIKKYLKERGFHINHTNNTTHNTAKNKPHIKIITSGLLMLNYIAYIINPLSYTLMNLDSKQKSYGKIKSNRKLNFAIIGEQDIYYYINQNILNKYDNIKFHWIYDKIAPNNIDYFIITILDNKSNFEVIQERLITWIKNNPSAKFLITSPELKDNINININDCIYPKNIIKLLKNNINESGNKYNIHHDMLKQININLDYPRKPVNEIIKTELEYHFDIKIKDSINKSTNTPVDNSNTNNIMIIDDTIESSFKQYENLNLYKTLVLSGKSKYNNLVTIDKERIDGLDFIIPDISYLVI
jgi:hypothetical protein